VGNSTLADMAAIANMILIFRYRLRLILDRFNRLRIDFSPFTADLEATLRK